MERRTDQPLNSIEIRHRDAIIRAGLDPEDFLFEAQLAALRPEDGWITEEAVQAIRDLRGWASSRFELVELLTLYHSADENIRTMQSMSADRVPFGDADFVIATEPDQIVSATVDSREFTTSVVDHPEVGPWPGESESIVWINAGSVNVLKMLATHFRRTLIAPYGDLQEFLRVLSEQGDTIELVARLSSFDTLPTESSELLRRAIDFVQKEKLLREDHRAALILPPLEPPPTDRSLAAAQSVLMTGFATFLAGHEAGHIFLGHTGTRRRSSSLRRIPEWISPRQADEIDADIVGLTSVWDGMSENYSASIDYTWLAPVLSLAAHAGMAALAAAVDPGSTQATDDLAGWVNRLRLLVHGMIINLHGNGFKAIRIRPIMRSVPPLAGAVYAWLGAGGMRAPSVRHPEAFDWSVYNLLTSDCSELQSEFGF